MPATPTRFASHYTATSFNTKVCHLPKYRKSIQPKEVDEQMAHLPVSPCDWFWRTGLALCCTLLVRSTRGGGHIAGAFSASQLGPTSLKKWRRPEVTRCWHAFLCRGITRNAGNGGGERCGDTGQGTGQSSAIIRFKVGARPALPVRCKTLIKCVDMARTTSNPTWKVPNHF